MVITVHPANVISPIGTLGTDNNIADPEFFEALVSLSNDNYQSSAQTKNTPQRVTIATPAFQNNALLNLSPQALNFLNGVDGTIDNNTTNNSNSTAFNNNAGFGLTAQQQLTSITSEFSNAPFDENTFAQIQATLLNAGIDPEQVSLQEMFQGMVSLSSPAAEAENDTYTTELAALLAA